MQTDVCFKPRVVIGIIFISTCLLACSGGGEGAGNSGTVVATSTGIFVDAPVQGLTVSSGSIQSTTDAAGGFQYTVGQPTTFRLGNLVLGTFVISGANAFVSPLNLAVSQSNPTPQITDNGVTNRLRFLQTVKSNSDPASLNLTQAALALQTLPPGTTLSWDQDPSLFNIGGPGIPGSVGASLQAAGISTTLVSAAAAQATFTTGLRCALGGFYSGTFSGSDTGSFGVGVAPGIGELIGRGFSNSNQANFFLNGVLTLNAASTVSFGVASTGANFSGVVSTGGTSGNWQNPPGGGAFTGTKMRLSLPVGTQGAIYRGVGFDTALRDRTSMGDVGPFVMAIGSSSLTGLAFSYDDQMQLSLTGTVTNNDTLDGQIIQGNIVLSNFHATISTDGTLGGQYTGIPGVGSSGSVWGCRTNS
ncbi:hypothetical protein [Nitrospira moscoviensis]|uniref:Carboxypeptidase regulatory-like domain-containing protein n=1 Tax=Nitrospira moscoviensis TaxID=42253 RepID=A0A0K2GHM8_NITMO|nr:hypothetical protein [Nitrospira moscoviensis]ALA60137.1 hypothetical protein NITMOv2_3746 [Nitrospira moscoviensis]